MEGKQAFDDKLFSRAIESFQAFVDSSPADPRVDQATYLMGVCHFYLRQYREALNYLTHFRRAFPGSLYINRTYYWMGLSYYALERYPEAVKEFSSQLSVEGEPHFKERSLQMMGFAYEKMGDYPKALNSYEQLIKITQNRELAASVIERQGVIQLQQKNYLRALYYFDRLGLEYNDVPQTIKEVPFYRGEALYGMGDFEQSRENYETFITLYRNSPNRPEALKKLGELAILQEDYTAARGYANHLLDRYKEEYLLEAYRLLAEVHLRQEENEEALVYLERLLSLETDAVRIQSLQMKMAQALSADPQTALEWFVLVADGPDPAIAAEGLYRGGVILANRGKEEAGIILLERLFNEHPESPYREQAGEYLAGYYDRKQMKLPLQRHLDRMIKDYPESANRGFYLYIRGNMAYRNGDPSTALKHYQNVINTEESNLEILNESRYRIGYIYSSRGEISRGNSYFETIIQTNQQNELYDRSLLSLGIGYLNLREYEQAQGVLARLVETVPPSPWAPDGLFYLGRAKAEQGLLKEAEEHYAAAARTAQGKDLILQSSYQLGWTQLKLGEFQKASNSFYQGWEQDRDSALAWESLYRAGTARSYDEDWQGGLEYYLMAQDNTSPELRPDLLYQISWNYLMLGELDKALPFLQELYTLDEGNSLAASCLYDAGRQMLGLNNPTTAILYFQGLAREFPNETPTLEAKLQIISLLDDNSEQIDRIAAFFRDHSGTEQSLRLAQSVKRAIKNGAYSEEDIQRIDYKVLPLRLTNSERALILLGKSYPTLRLPGAAQDILLLKGYKNLSPSVQTELDLAMGIARYWEGKQDDAALIFHRVLGGQIPALSAEAQFYLSSILADQGEWKRAADSYLVIRYRYPAERSWVKLGLYRAALAYARIDDWDSYNEVSQILLQEFQDEELMNSLKEEARAIRIGS